MHTAETLAKLVLAAAKCYEDSYDRVAATAAATAADAEKAADPTNIYAGMVDFQKFYKLDMRQAAEKVCSDADQQNLSEPIWLLMFTAWNDAMDWAKTLVPQTV
jgi:hypothetical protein